MIYDYSSGDLTKSALVGWVDLSIPANPVFTRKVYLIDKGFNEDGDPYGLKKLVIEKMEVGIFYIRYSNLNRSEEYSFEIAKNSVIELFYCLGIPSAYLVPVYNIPKSIYVIWSLILVFKIICMLPYIKSQNRDTSDFRSVH